MIQTYFTQIKRIIDQYAATSFVLEAQMHFDMRPGDQGYHTGTLIFADDSTPGSPKFGGKSQIALSSGHE